jgi:hypothetical protein
MSPSAVVRTDGLFEIGLGLVLVAGAASGWLDGGDFPAPVGTTVIVVVGVALIALGAVLWQLAGGSVPPQLLRNLAIGNSVTALAATVWRLAAEGFSAAGSAIVLATAVGLLALAAAQYSLVTARAGRALRR